jgi:hypothetical protein
VKSKIRHELFLEIWDERETNGYVTCFETGKKLKREIYRMNSACYSHILPKSKYPEYDLVKMNIEIVHPDAHGNYENNCEKAPNQCNRKKELLAMHYLGNLKD